MSRPALRDERGLTLIEMLVAMSLSLVIFGATLNILTGANRSLATTNEHNDRQQEARVAIERLSRDLRNLASPTDLGAAGAAAPRGVDRNGRYDLIFKTVDGQNGPTATNQAATKRVRYCLDNSDPMRGRLLMQQQTSITYTAAAPPATACPAPGWTGTPLVVADHLSNRVNGRDRPVFSYSSQGDEIPYDSPEALTATTRVEVDLWLDGKPGSCPFETAVSSSVLLRNQNRAPTAAFTATVSGRIISLNGSDAEDPENEPMIYAWFEGANPATATPLGGGASVIHTLPTRLPGTYTFLLKVTDSAGTVDFSDPVTVTVL